MIWLDNLIPIISTSVLVAILSVAQDLRASFARVRELERAEEVATMALPVVAALEPEPVVAEAALPRRTPIAHPTHAVQQDAPSVDTIERVLSGLRRVVEPVRTETPVWDMNTPIFDALVRDRQARIAALRTPTREFNVIVANGWNTSERRLLGRPPLVEAR